MRNLCVSVCLAVLLVIAGCGSGGGAEPVAVLPPADPPPGSDLPPVILATAYSNPDLSLEPLADCQAVKTMAAASLRGQFLAIAPDALSSRPLTPARLAQIDTDASGNAYLLRDHLLVIADGTQSGQLIERSRTELETAGTAEGFLLDDLRGRLLAVFGNAPNPQTGYSPYGTRLVSVDISDPVNPVEAGSIWLEGERVDLVSIESGYRVVSRAVTDRGAAIWFLNPPLRSNIDAYRAAIAAGDIAVADRLALEIGAVIDEAVGLQDATAFLPLAISNEPAASMLCTDVWAPRIDLQPGLAVVTTLDPDAGLIDRYAVQNNSGDVATVAGTLYLAQSTQGLAHDDGSLWTVVHAINADDTRPDGARYGAISQPVTDVEFVGLENAIGILGQRFAETTVQDFYRLDDNGTNELALSGEIVAFASGLRLDSRRLGDALAVQVLNGLTPYWFTIDAALSIPLGPLISSDPLSAIVPMDTNHAFGLLQSAPGVTDAVTLMDTARPDLPVLLQTIQLAVIANPTRSDVDENRLIGHVNGGSRRLLLPLRQSGEAGTFTGFLVIDGTGGLTADEAIDHSALAFAALCGDTPALALPANACSSSAYLDWLKTGDGTTWHSNDVEIVYGESSVGLTATVLSDGAPVTAELVLPFQLAP